MRPFSLQVLSLVLLCFAVRAEDVVFAAYNVRNYLIEDQRDERGKLIESAKSDKEIEAVLAVVQKINPDILGIVEMGDEAALRSFQTRLKEKGLDLPHSEWVRGTDPHRHLALLSRYPIRERESVNDVPFELDGKPERMARGLLDVTIELPGGGLLRVLGAHLKSRRPLPGVDDRAMRALEAWHLRQRLVSVMKEKPEGDVLVFGDFNDYRNEAPVREIIGKPGTSTYMRDLPLTDSRGEKWTFLWQEADLYSRIDFIFVSPRLWKKILLPQSGIVDIPEWSEASDHRAIFTTLQTDAP